MFKFSSASPHLSSEDVKIKMKKIIVLPPVLHGCETWSLRLRKEREPGIFEKKVLRKIF
jgi:hypothetical protein